MKEFGQHSSGKKSNSLSPFLEAYERFYAWLFQIKEVAPQEGFLRVGITRYRGPGIVLLPQVEIKKGELVGELHLNNGKIMQLRGESPDQLALYANLLGRFRRSLARLAELTLEDPRFSKIRAFRGTTLLYRGMERLGFQIFPMESKINELFETRIQYFFLRRYFPEGFEGKKQDKLVSHRLWISVLRLRELYGPKGK